MSNFHMAIPFFDVPLRCETEGYVVCLNDMVNAANHYRLGKGMPILQLASFTGLASTAAYVAAAAEVWGVPESTMIYKVGKGNRARTMAHISIAVLLAEHVSPAFHAKLHKIFIEGKLLEFRARGGTEFQSLNSAIDAYLPDRKEEDGTMKNNLGIYITAAKQLRSGILGDEAGADDWNKASVSQTHRRYEVERTLVQNLKRGLIRDFEHLKLVIAAEVAA